MRPPAKTEADQAVADRIFGQSQMATRIREFAWEKTELGAIDDWSDSLLSAVNFVLASPVSTILMVGPSFTTLYNDRFIGGKTIKSVI